MAIVRERPRQAAEAHFLRPGATHEYVVSGASTRLSAQLALFGQIPSYEAGLDITGTEITIYLHTILLKEEGGGVWTATARYESTPDATQFNVTYGARSEKIFQAIEHVLAYSTIDGSTDDDPNLYTGPYFNGAIGINGDEIEGVEVEASNVEFMLSKVYRISGLPQDYIQGIFEMMSFRTPVNDAEWSFIWKNLTFEFPAGSLRLREVPIKWTSNDEVEISYRFHYSRPIVFDDSFSIGDSAYITKKGHEYLWVYYDTVEESGRTTKKATAVSIDQVYPEENFNFLEI